MNEWGGLGVFNGPLSWAMEGAKAACEGCGYLEGGQVARDRDWHAAAHLKGASNEPARGAVMASGPQLTNSLLRRA